jgi:hypothetical protein
MPDFITGVEVWKKRSVSLNKKLIKISYYHMVMGRAVPRS